VGAVPPSVASSEARRPSGEEALELLARALRSDLLRLERGWLVRCSGCQSLTEEDSRYTAALSRALAPLVTAWAHRRRDLAEIHALELFQELGSLGLPIAATLAAIDCLHGAVRELQPSADTGNDELRRFLIGSAVELATNPTAPRAWEESGRRPRPSVPCFLGSSPSAVRLRAELADLADAPGSVLIVGESGTGKELVAQTLHQSAARRSAPFLAVNCSALPRELIESELFGHERGAFTGSRESAPGLLRAAQDGTVFLDEITEMPEALQPKLLRALEQRAVRPVGGLRELPIHARIVAATNRDPERAVRAGQLRADLYYRLCVHRVDVPVLRDRLGDLPELAAHFLAQVATRGHRAPAGLSQAALELLGAHDWPGNVRELRNVIEHCCATAKGVVVQPEHLPHYLRQRATEASSGTFRVPRVSSPELEPTEGALPTLPEMERQHIERVLTACGGNKTVAAKLLGISRHQLYLRLERFGLASGS
jgi:DNA-binding NtrC family response regulator